MSQRSQRLGDLIRQELSNLILREVKDPRVKLASVSEVIVSGDLSHARISIAVLGEDTDREGCLKGLKSAAGFLRTKLGSKLRLRTVPLLDFHLDRNAEHSQRISDLIEGLEIPDLDQSRKEPADG